jgi:hypothetical protein
MNWQPLESKLLSSSAYDASIAFSKFVLLQQATGHASGSVAFLPGGTPTRHLYKLKETLDLSQPDPSRRKLVAAKLLRKLDLREAEMCSLKAVSA